MCVLKRMAEKKKERKRLETRPYKGVRDFYPEDMWVEQYIFEVWSIVAESFGYERYNASVLEPAELFKVKSGDEIVNEQTYTFVDRGEREVTLRPEMTPSVVRMVSARERALTFPLRWYSIPNLFRYERPQNGRLREHWQLNCDLFGVAGIDADVELILLADAIMRGFGATQKDYSIHISHLGALSEAFESLGIPEDKHAAVRKLLDQQKKSKTFAEDLKSECGKSFEEITAALENAPKMTEFRKALASLEALGVTNAQFDSAIVRGQDYYTGIVFEVFDTDPSNNRSMFGGGRYDELLELFGTENIPATGFGMGDVTMRNFLEAHSLLPEMPAQTDLFIATLSPELITDAQKLAELLRQDGLNVRVNMTEKKLGDQIKTASKANVPYVLVLGEDEVQSGNYTLKELATGEETAVTQKDIAPHISK